MEYGIRISEPTAKENNMRNKYIIEAGTYGEQVKVSLL